MEHKMEENGTKKKNAGEDHLMFESVLELVGGLGRFQALFMFFAGMSCIISASNHVAVLFLGSTPKFSCANWTSEVNSTNGDACFADVEKTVPCRHFIFDKSEYESTLVTEWNLVCDRVFLLPVIQGTYFGGVIMGDLIGGIASDAFGRRNTLLVICVIHMISAYSAIFVRNYWLFVFVRLFIGGTSHAAWSILNVLTIEIITAKHRTLVSSIFSSGWKIGYGLLALMGYFIRAWPMLQMAIALINLVMISYYWIVPESPRWLLAAGRFSDAENIMRQIAHRNGTDRKLNFEADFKGQWDKVVGTFATKVLYNEDGSQRKVSFWNTVKEILHQMKAIMHVKVARKMFLLLVWPWTMCGLAYYGIFLSVKLVNIDKYTLTAITCGFELIILMCAIYPIDKFGRTTCMIATFSIGGILGMMIMAFSKSSPWARPVLIIMGKTVCSINFLGTGLLTKEIFPTSVRNATSGLLDACSKIGAAIAPFLVDLLSIVDHGLPNLVIGVLTISAAIPFFFLPETSGRNITESIECMEKLNKYSIVAKCKNIRKRKVHPIVIEK